MAFWCVFALRDRPTDGGTDRLTITVTYSHVYAIKNPESWRTWENTQGITCFSLFDRVKDISPESEKDRFEPAAAAALNCDGVAKAPDPALLPLETSVGRLRFTTLKARVEVRERI